MIALTETDNLVAPRPPEPRLVAVALHLLLPLTLVLALVVRLALIVRSPGVLDGDEALVGIQAERIAAGLEHPLPVFFYGQHYMGALESYLAAGLFRLVGPSVPALRLIPLFFALLLVALTYELARRVAGRQEAVIAALLAALPPLYIGVWSLKARGGYIETITLGTALLIVTHRLLYGRGEALGLITAPLTPRRRWRELAWWPVWGLLAGLLFWINPISVYYIITGALALFFSKLRAHGWRVRRRDALAAWPQTTLVLLGALVGGLPLWVDNIASGGATFRFLLSGAGGDPSSLLNRPPRVAAYLFTAVLPKLTGAWEPWGAATNRALGALALALYTLAGVYLLVRLLAGRRGVLGYRARPRHGQGLLLAFALVVALVFSFSGFGATALNTLGFDAATRYALPLTSVLPVSAAALIGRLWRVWAPLGAAVLAVLLLMAAWGYVSAQPGQVFQSEYWSKLPDSEAPLAHFLEQRHIRDVWMNHWAGDPLMFYADGRIAAADYNDVVLHTGVNRLPWAMWRAWSDRHAAYVLVTPQANPPLAHLLTAQGATFTASRVGPYLVFWNLSKHVRPVAVEAGIGFSY